MANVLDLQNSQPAEQLPASFTGDVVTPVRAVTVDPADSPRDFAELAALALAPLTGPRVLSWEAHHRLGEQSRRRHYMLMGAFAFVGGVIAIWQASWTTTIVVLLGLATWEARERWSVPVSVRVDETGLTVDSQQFSHAELTSFDIHYMPDDLVELSVKTNKWLMPLLRLPLGDQDPEEVRAVMANYVPQEAHAIPLVDYYLRRP